MQQKPFCDRFRTVCGRFFREPDSQKARKIRPCAVFEVGGADKKR